MFLGAGVGPVVLQNPISTVAFTSTQAVIGEVSTIWEVDSLQYSGLKANGKVYVRAESKLLWKELENIHIGETDLSNPPNAALSIQHGGYNDSTSVKRERMIVQGPPGIGKSTELYGWIQHKRKTHKILYCHYDGDCHHVVLFDMHGLTKYLVVEDDGASSILKQLIANQIPKDVQIAVCDGYPKDKSLFTRLCSSFTQCPVINCSSYGATYFMNTEYVAKCYSEGGLSIFDMNSWTLEEYRSAFVAGVFTGNISTNEELNARYFYGGGSIRLLLMTEAECIKAISLAMDKISNANELSQGLTGKSSNQAINTLFQRSGIGPNSVYTPVSEYVSRKLVGIVDGSFIAQAKNINTDNPAFQGWIFEMEALYLIKHKRLVVSQHGVGNKWNKYDHSVEFGISTDGLGKLKRNTLLIPTVYNQGLFDIMLYECPGHLHIANMTIAKIHLFNMKLILPFLSLFKDSNGKCVLEFDIIIPFNKSLYFKISKKHFQLKHTICKYDVKWKASSTASSLCKVLLMLPNETVINDNFYEYPAENENFEKHGMLLRKRKVASNDNGVEDAEEEDAEEVEDATDTGAYEIYDD